MRTSFIVGIFLVVLAAAALGSAGFLYIQDTRNIKETKSKIDSLQKERKQLRDEMRDTGLQYRGFQESVKALPDSTKRAQSRLIIDQLSEYNKKLGLLERDDQDFSTKIKKLRASESEMAGRVRRTEAPIAGTGVLLLVLGVVMVRRRR